MADNNHLNRDNAADVADDDPFAELARIMNQGVQGKTQPTSDEVAAEGPAGDPLAVDLERELLGELDDGFDQPGQDYDELSEAAEEAPPVEADSAFANAGADGPELGEDSAADPLADYAADQPGYEPDDVDEWNAAEPAFDDRSWRATDDAVGGDDWQEAPETAPVETYDDAAVLADVDMDFGDLDAPAPAAYDAAAQDEPAVVAASAQGDVTLEDELEMLLTGGSSAEEDYAGSEMETDPWQEPGASNAPQSTIFGRANFSGDDRYRESGIHADDSMERDEARFDEADAEAPDAGEVENDPFAALASVGADMSTGAEKTALPPDFETVEVPETTLAQHDDLDLPELPADVPPLPEDEFEAHFGADLDDDMPPRTEPVTASSAYREEPAIGDDDDFYAQALGFGTDGQPADDYGARVPALSDDDNDDDLAAAAIAAAAVSRQGKQQPNRRGGFMVAGVVLGVALLGGIGAFALSVGGDDSGTPVLVRADDEPMKIKPEDPGGGAVVPNQDSVAYEAASGGTSGSAPRQETLVSTTEEPVNIASRTIETDRLPGVDEGPASDDGALGKAEDRLAVNAAETGDKLSEDVIAVQPRRVRTMVVRPDGTLVPRDEDDPVEAVAQQEPIVADEPAAALPAVQPAGTTSSETVETQLPVTLPATETAAAEPPQTVVAAATEPEPAATQPQESAAVEPADPVTPRVGPVAPSRPATQTATQPQQVAQAAPAPARTQPAAPAPAATASSEWSMQIASQPSAESAQATYQDLARRYGDLLGGRGVNIVRAEIEGKGTYYRVRIPTSSRNDGVALCERYKAAGGSCFVSK